MCYFLSPFLSKILSLKLWKKKKKIPRKWKVIFEQFFHSRNDIKF